jgi:hypothetical protein
MAGLATFDRKKSIAATTPIAAALKFCILETEKWAPESPALTLKKKKRFCE